jgi:hypothetical protein
LAQIHGNGPERVAAAQRHPRMSLLSLLADAAVIAPGHAAADAPDDAIDVDAPVGAILADWQLQVDDSAIDDVDAPDGAILADWQPRGPRLWAGKQRSSTFMRYLRSKKEAKRNAMRANKAVEALGRVAKPWNAVHALRFGDRIHDVDAENKRKSNKLAKPHPNEWCIAGMMRVAFKALGGAVVKHGRCAVGQTHRTLRAMSVTASSSSNKISTTVVLRIITSTSLLPLRLRLRLRLLLSLLILLLLLLPLSDYSDFSGYQITRPRIL